MAYLTHGFTFRVNCESGRRFDLEGKRTILAVRSGFVQPQSRSFLVQRTNQRESITDPVNTSNRVPAVTAGSFGPCVTTGAGVAKKDGGGSIRLYRALLARESGCRRGSQAQGTADIFLGAHSPAPNRPVKAEDRLRTYVYKARFDFPARSDSIFFLYWNSVQYGGIIQWRVRISRIRATYGFALSRGRDRVLR